jgi:hypothetical protein
MAKYLMKIGLLAEGNNVTVPTWSVRLMPEAFGPCDRYAGREHQRQCSPLFSSFSLYV